MMIHTEFCVTIDYIQFTDTACASRETSTLLAEVAAILMSCGSHDILHWMSLSPPLGLQQGSKALENTFAFTALNVLRIQSSTANSWSFGSAWSNIRAPARLTMYACVVRSCIERSHSTVQSYLKRQSEVSSNRVGSQRNPFSKRPPM